MAEVSQASIDFITLEIEQVHALCDRALVPRDLDEQLLSMAQRVAILEGVQRGLVGQLGMESPDAFH